MIWENCPACAHKHLTAAYAAVTSPSDSFYYVPAPHVLVARAAIAVQESRTGYPGNKALALGCLALAEAYPYLSLTAATELRNARLALMKLDVAAEDPGCGVRWWEPMQQPTSAAYAAAHIAEALRELPELAEKTDAESLFNSHGDFETESTQALRDWLRESIAWLEDTYELNAPAEAPAPAPAPARASAPPPVKVRYTPPPDGGYSTTGEEAKQFIDLFPGASIYHQRGDSTRPRACVFDACKATERGPVT